ncbi:sigma-54 dependent transcriptional regulator, partial [Acidovorax facilis]
MNAPTASILVVDDEPDLRTLYELTLLREGYRVETASSVQEAREQLKAHRFDAVITDMRLPDGFGMELLQDLRDQQRRERCVVMTAYGSAENAVEALRSGAFDYLTKPVDLKQFRSVVASAVQGTGGVPAPRAARTGGVQGRQGAFSADPLAAGTALDRLVGTSEAIRNVKQRVAKVARGMAPVLIHGESGTGKELVAQALHASSQRADGPLVAVNCGAIPENLLEAEFFGARKGSYTGATQDRDGYFQAARGGTLFLDEIGDLPLAMQSKLLRAIQERSVRPLGSTQEETVDVRIVSATHRDLAADVQSGRFRQDLYYRLNVIEIVIPPLRERREDLPVLCAALLARIAQESGMPVPSLTEHALQAIAAHPLTGNVRELENLLHRAVALSDGDELHVDWPSGTPTPL